MVVGYKNIINGDLKHQKHARPNEEGMLLGCCRFCGHHTPNRSLAIEFDAWEKVTRFHGTGQHI